MNKSEFEIKIKNREISQPTQKTFSLKKWQKEYNSIGNKTERDESLFSAGNWIFNRLDRIRQEVCKVSLPLPKEKLIKIHVGYINRTYNFVRLKTQIEKRSEDMTIFSEQIIQSKLTGNTMGKDLSPDTILTSCVDGARFPLTLALLSDDEKESKITIDALNVISNEQKIMLLGQYYSYLEEAWREILWNDNYIVTKDDMILIRPKGTIYDQARAISEYRKLAILQQGIGQTVHIWNTQISNKKKKELSTRPVIKIEGCGKKRKITLSYDDTVEHVPPYPFIARILSHEEYLEDLLTSDLPSLPGVSINLLLHSWEVIGAYVKPLAENFPADDSVYAIGTLYTYAPSILRKDLIDLLMEICKVDHIKADSIIEFFTFNPNGMGDLWSRPLVRLDDKLLPLISPILTGNLLRNMELWLKCGGVDLGKRGNLFEMQVRKEITDSINSNSSFKNSGCHDKSIKLGENKEEIDIVFYIGNKILVGEAKCSLYPTDPIEYYNIFDTLKYASEQAKRKALKVTECFDEMKQKIEGLRQLQIDNIQVIPFIITNTTLGVGYSIDNVPIVDLFLLNRFFDGKWEKYVTFGPKGSKEVGETITFYSSEDEASNYIEMYLQNPPQIELFKPFIKADYFPHIRFDEDEIQAISSSLIVELPVPELSFKQ